SSSSARRRGRDSAAPCFRSRGPFWNGMRPVFDGWYEDFSDRRRDEVDQLRGLRLRCLAWFGLVTCGCSGCDDFALFDALAWVARMLPVPSTGERTVSGPKCAGDSEEVLGRRRREASTLG